MYQVNFAFKKYINFRFFVGAVMEWLLFMSSSSGSTVIIILFYY